MPYDIYTSFEENMTYGPTFHGKIPKFPIQNHPKIFLGHLLNSPFGIPACPLTANARSIRLMSRLGFDLLTYKSVRSREWRGNSFPHWKHIHTPSAFSPHLQKSVVTKNDPMNGNVSMANSFGVQSVKPEYWQEDVDHAVGSLQRGQLLILSLLCTPQKREPLKNDAKRLGKLAHQTRAEIFELNLACPNLADGHGLIFEDIRQTQILCDAIKQEIGNIPLLIKVGYYEHQSLIEELLRTLQSVISGISTMNTYAHPVIESDGSTAFPGRIRAGISGAVIRKLAMRQVRTILRWKRRLKLDQLAVIGIGGVTESIHINSYLDLGVDAVQSAVGAFADPSLAIKYKNNS